MVLRRENVEAVAEAVDAITDAKGLRVGEALWVFTSMLLTTLKAADMDVRDHLRNAVVASLDNYSERPLAKVLVDLPATPSPTSEDK